MNHPTRDAWAQAGRRLLVKAVEEFAYEELLVPVAYERAPSPEDTPTPYEGAAASPEGTPVPEGAPVPYESAAPFPESAQGDAYRLDFDDGVHWTFRATRSAFEAWHVDPDSLRRHPDAAEEAGPERLLLDARTALGWDGPTLAEALRELTATRRADAEAVRRALPAADLADLGHLDLEAYQDGHPSVLLDKGRVGFSASDAAAYGPEAARAVRLTWAAVHSGLATYAGVRALDGPQGLPAERLLAEELDPRTRERFAATLDQACAESGFEADAFVWLPVHPYQWDEAVATLFAPYLVDGRIVQLGQSADRYRPLRPVRTLANLDRPHRRVVKLPLLLRDSGAWRGLPAGPTGAAPEVSAWLREVREGDPYLRDELRFHPLAEVASVTVRHPLYGEVGDAPYRYHELLGAVWREPVATLLRERERARTVASLLLGGADGRTLAEELVARSGLGARAWLERFFAALLPGLLHHLYRYGVAFHPHGGNTVVIFDGHDIPIGIAVKDFAESVTVLRGDQESPAGLPRRPAGELAHSLLSTLFAGHFRFLAPQAAARLGVPARDFWALVRAEIERYHARFPELADRYASFGLLAPSFGRATLNRERLGGDAFHGTVANPLAPAAASEAD
ncbi:IucA/IucC family protein [Streptomyces sp. NPDC101062]|uniref:IucA/IucC family protein n=1 Tax=unclassified Streptomyces TaxID=2593676 RepID=UPI0037FD15BF